MARIVGKQVALNQARFLNGYLGDARHIMAHSPNLSISADATRVGGKDILAICFTCEFQRRFVSFWAPPQAIASIGEGRNKQREVLLLRARGSWGVSGRLAQCL